jgi:hypothetical protein
MAVSGAALHRGQPAIALAAAERAIAEMEQNGSNAFEPGIVRAGALLQSGRVDEALVAIESLPPHREHHPFTHAVAALVHMVAGDGPAAVEHAAIVAHADGATYLDRVFALVGAAGGHALQGDRVQAESSAEEAVATAMAVGDVVATGLATATYLAVTGHVHPAHDDRTPLAEGWERVVGDLTRLLA